MQEQYGLEVGEKGNERLHLINKLYNENTQQFLLSNGLTTGKKVLEVGCGNGIMALWLAKQVGPSGHVLATDASADQIAIAKTLAEKNNIQNINFECVSIYDLDKIKEEFDIAYCRWVLVHLREPVLGLQNMHHHVAKGGHLVIEDTDLTTFFAIPEHSAVSQFNGLHATLFEAENKDFQFGYQIPKLLEELHYHDIQTKLFQPVLSNAYEKMVFAMSFNEYRRAILESEILTEMAFESMLSELTDFSQQNHFAACLRNVLVAGKK